MPRQIIDHGTTRAAMRARLAVLAYERPHIQKEEIKTAMRGGTAPIIAFCRRHEVNLDWLFLGDIRGLLAMAEWARCPGSYAIGSDP
jgi:hypothetical protein